MPSAKKILKEKQNKNVYECEVCKKRLANRTNFNRHLQIHDNNRQKFKCDKCNLSFTREDYLIQHKECIHEEGARVRHPCTFCGKRLPSPSMLEGHMRSHIKEKPFFCKLCPWEGSEMKRLKQHLKINHESNPEKQYQCPKCPQKFFTVAYRNSHLRIHASDRKLYQCNLCLKYLSTKPSLKFHELVHKGTKNFHCKICHKAFRTSRNLDLHSRSHSGFKPYRCEICGKTFSWLVGLVNHMTTHTGEKPYQCKQCPKTFSRVQHLKSHTDAHLGIKRFTCEICGKKCFQSKDLENHLRVHTLEKPFPCQICKRRFKVKQNLKLHMRTHNGEKPYSCDWCHKTFSQKGNLKGHVRRVHGINGSKRFQV